MEKTKLIEPKTIIDLLFQFINDNIGNRAAVYELTLDQAILLLREIEDREKEAFSGTSRV